MPNYQNGKIYKITGECGGVYYGSTSLPLWSRRGSHNKHKNCQASLLKNWKLELVENYPCNSKEELLWRERHWIENNECVNKKKPIMTNEERRNYRLQKNKRHNEKNRVKITCECGAQIFSAGIKKHLKTSKHLNSI